MRKITFIAPYKEILTIGQEVIEELGIADKVDCFQGAFKQGVGIAHRAENSGADVIVTRGGTAEYIAKSGIHIPIVEIPISVQDLAESLTTAKAMIAHGNPRIAVMAFSNMIRSIEVFAKVMDIYIMIYQLDSEEEIPSTVERALRDNPDVLIGGIQTTRLAAKQGVKTILLTTGKDSFRAAFLQAEKVSYARQLEKERMQKFRVLVDYSIQGIISIDRKKRIEVFNHAAQRLLDCDAEKVLGKNIETICPSLTMDSCLNEGKILRGELIKSNTKKLIANIVPIEIDGCVTGAMITIEDVGQIMEMEAAIRKDIYAKGLTAEYHFHDILGVSPQIAEVKRVAEEYAEIDATVLIMGASGTGKELFAQSIHNTSKRRQRAFVAVNCGAIPPNLLESELFGYVEGAFTGATKKGKAGLFELAHGGTIFLDEIGEMDKLAQTSLLRVIQERRIMRLGDDKYLPVNVRIIAATNKKLTTLVEEGKFREDLYYRINVLPLALPVLKDRCGDAVCIAEHFVSVYNRMFGRRVTLDETAKECIRDYGWPGNIRQLRNIMERLVIVTKDNHVSAELVASMLDVSGGTKQTLQIQAEQNDCSERGKILRVLAEKGFNQKETAKALGIDRSTLYRKLKSLDIKVKKNCTM